MAGDENARRVPVLIVGGGPIGLGIAVELGWQGVPCLLLEQGDGRIIDAKMFHTGTRTVEFCRRWGFADKVRNWGFPHDYPLDTMFVTGLNGYELGRIRVPSFDETPELACSPEDYTNCPQFVFDPMLAEKARGFHGVTLRFQCRMESFEDTSAHGDDHVRAEIVDLVSGKREIVTADYMVGCDGYSSFVRKTLGIAMQGRPFFNKSTNIMLRTRDLNALHDKGKAGRYVLIGPGGPWATLVPADGRELWRLMVYGSEELDVEAMDVREQVRKAVGRDFEFEILTTTTWVRRMMIADSYRKGRVFLAGDCVHAMPPNGGLGMNTGMGDAVDLGWKLAATIQGWGGAHLLDSYEPERRPIGIRSATEASKNFERLVATKPAKILDDTPEGAELRRQVGKRLEDANRQAWEEPLSIHLGYRYIDSPICVPDGTPEPPEPPDSRIYDQTSRPGARAPHAWLKDGRSTLDLFGRGFTLLRFGRDAPVADALADAAKKRGLPFSVTTIDEPEIARLYERRLVLVRPDGHVAWRGDSMPDEPALLIDRVRGALPPGAAKAAAA